MRTKTVIFISNEDGKRYAVRVAAENSGQAQIIAQPLGRFVRFMQTHENAPTKLNKPVLFE